MKLSAWKQRAAAKLPCRHCGPRTGKRGNRCRGLCYGCFMTLSIRKQYSVASNGERRADVADSCCPVVLPEPTDTLPGTEERIRVMQERARLRLAVKHPQDRERESA